MVYSNTALFVLPDGLSSTSMPALMTRMLETLDVQDGQDVLEIGAGTGYNSALLSYRLGDQHVFAIDIEPTLIRLARERLAKIGYHTLVTADGANGLPEHAPYDRIIVTCSVPAVPWTWVEQTREEGLILADVKPAQLAGNLVLLRRTHDGAEGRFDRTYGSFMVMRRTGETYGSPTPGPPGTAPPPAAAQAPSTSPDHGNTRCCGFSRTFTYPPALHSGWVARTPADHLTRRSCPQPTARGARSKNQPPTARARSGKPDPTNCGASSRTHTPPGSRWVNPYGSASG